MGRSAELTSWFHSVLSNVRCSNDVRAYVAGVLSQFAASTANDMSRTSVVLAYRDALETGSFEAHQRIGDWSLYVCSVHGPVAVLLDIGSVSYLTCYRLTGNTWGVYEELARTMPVLSVAINEQLGVYPSRA